jgi:hypothetical protein
MGKGRVRLPDASMNKNAFEELKITNDRLLVFVDDTGHETFKGSHGYCGLGGCIFLNWRPEEGDLESPRPSPY